MKLTYRSIQVYGFVTNICLLSALCVQCAAVQCVLETHCIPPTLLCILLKWRFCFKVSGVGLRVCNSNKLPDDADTAGHTLSSKHLNYFNKISLAFY